MTIELSEFQKVSIKQGHKNLAEPNTLCRCGGWLKPIKYQFDLMRYGDHLDASEKELRRLKVCEDCGALYAMPEVIERGA